MRTGFRVDMQEVLRDGFVGWCERWEANRGRDSGWELQGVVERANRMMFDVDTYAGAGLPRSLAMCDITMAGVGARRPTWVDEVEKVLAPLRVDHVSLELFDFGVATVSIDLWPTQPLLLDNVEALRQVEEMSSRMCGINSFSTWCADQLERAKTHIDPPFLKGPSSQDEVERQGVWRAADPGCILWMHRLPIFARAKVGSPHIERPVEELVSADMSLALRYRQVDQEMTLAPSIGSSVIVVECGEPDFVAAVLHDVVTLQNAYWAGAQELASVVLRRTNELAALRRKQAANAIRRHAYQAVDLHDQVGLFRSLMADQIIRLPPLHLDLWERVAKAWKTEQLMTEIEARQRDLAQLGSGFLASVQEVATTRLNFVLLLLTIANAIAVFAVGIDFTQGEPLTSPNVARMLVLGAVAVLCSAIAIVYSSVRRAARALE